MASVLIHTGDVLRFVAMRWWNTPYGENKMMTAKLLAVAAAAGLLIGTTSLSCAQGAKDSAPGQRMQNNETPPVQDRRGASGYAPGQQMRQDGSKSSQEPGASGYAPGHQPPTTGQGGTPKSR
jgi:hypothetical protein